MISHNLSRKNAKNLDLEASFYRTLEDETDKMMLNLFKATGESPRNGSRSSIGPWCYRLSACHFPDFHSSTYLNRVTNYD